VTAGRGGGRAAVDRWAAGREVLRAADPQMAALMEADPELDRELDSPASVEQVDAIGERFRPWRTLAAVYLYRTRTA
jgi:3-methyladenine DNA glycosylase/8-oxoguanine DNA glycosylase